jgi:hypothetical protein
MTTLSVAREAIYNVFNVAWANRTDLTFDNEKFTPPEDKSWVRLAVRHQDSSQETLGAVGNRKFLREGIAFIQVFTVMNTGVKSSDDLVEIARAVYEGTRISGTTIRFKDVIAREVGVDKSWFLVVIEAIFEYNETK